MNKSESEQAEMNEVGWVIGELGLFLEEGNRHSEAFFVFAVVLGFDGDFLDADPFVLGVLGGGGLVNAV